MGDYRVREQAELASQASLPGRFRRIPSPTRGLLAAPWTPASLSPLRCCCDFGNSTNPGLDPAAVMGDPFQRSRFFGCSESSLQLPSFPPQGKKGSSAEFVGGSRSAVTQPTPQHALMPWERMPFSEVKTAVRVPLLCSTLSGTDSGRKPEQRRGTRTSSHIQFRPSRPQILPRSRKKKSFRLRGLAQSFGQAKSTRDRRDLVKIHDDHMYHGSALLQIAEHPEFTAINAFRSAERISRSAFRVNDNIGVYLKYASKPTPSHEEYVFQFNAEHLAELARIAKVVDKAFLALVCVKGREICCLPYEMLAVLVERRKQAKKTDERQYSVLVTMPFRKEFRVYVNAPGRKNALLGKAILIPRSDFPDRLFARR